MRQAKCEKCKDRFHPAHEEYIYCPNCHWKIETARNTYKRFFEVLPLYSVTDVRGKRLFAGMQGPI